MNETNHKEAAVTVDVSARRIARVYAEALLNAADKKGQTAQVLDELDGLIDDVFNRHAQLEVLFSAAAVGRHARQAAIEKAFTGNTGETFVNFLLVLNEHERLELLRAIRQGAHEINDERRRRLRVQVQSAVPLPDQVRESLIERVRGAYNMEPVIEATIAPELLGGFKLRVRDHQVDATLSTYLDNLCKHLLSRGSHEIQSRRDHFSSAT